MLTLGVRVGNVEISDVFGAVARTDTDIAVLIRRSRETVGRSADTVSTAFTDGCPGPIDSGRDRRHESTDRRLVLHRHAAAAREAGRERIAHRQPGRVQAKMAIVAEVERLHWRICNGKARNARLTLERIRKVMHVFKGERGHRTDGRTLPQAVARIARGGRLSPWPERPARQLRRTPPRKPATQDFGDRRYGQLSGQSANEQGAADAMVSTGAADSVCGLQRCAWPGIRPPV